MMKDTTVSNDTCNMTVRLYDGKTGRLSDVYRGRWQGITKTNMLKQVPVPPHGGKMHLIRHSL